MVPLIAAKSAEVAALCRRFHVRRLEVFGSAAREHDFDPAHSDIDFLVEFTEHPDGMSLGNFFDLKEALEGVFGRPVDLLMPGAIRNPYLKASVDRSRVEVFGA